MKKYLFICSISLFGLVHTQQMKQNSEQRTLNNSLLSACFRGNDHDVSQLLAKRAQPACSLEGTGKTALMIACAKGYRAVVFQLLKRLGKQGINVKISDGVSALVLACIGNDPVIVKGLLNKGAILNEPVKGDKTVLMLSCNNISVLKVLLTHAKNHLLPDDFAAFINAQSDQDRTALIYACHYGAYESAQLLLEMNADPNITEAAMKKTALQYAVSENNPDLVELLLKHKADIECKDAFKHTALSIAVSQKNIPMVRLLKEHGADPSCRIGVSDTEILAVAQQAPNLKFEGTEAPSSLQDNTSAQHYAEQIGSISLQRALTICGNEACKKPGPKSTCAGCKSVHYCNSECQKADWKNHKSQCKKLRAQANENTES